MTAPDRLPLPTLAVLFAGYACCYFHRADLSALAPLWAKDQSTGAMSQALPDIASLGMLVYGFGKMIGGMLADRFGGRPLLVAALCGATVAELAASRCETPAAFALCRVCGMAALSLAWPAVGKVASESTPVARLGTAMMILSQSHLLGDAAVRALLAAVVDRGGGSVHVLQTASAGLALGAVVVAIGLFCTRPRFGAPLPAPGGVQGTPRLALRSLLRPMVWMALMNVSLVFVRESLSLWTPFLLVDLCAMPAAGAVRASALLPLAGACGALLSGPFGDRGARGLLVATFAPSLVAACLLVALAVVGGGGGSWFVIAALAATSCCLAVPLTLGSGVLPLRAGAGRSASMLGFVDGTGSLGAVLAGGGLARVLGGVGIGGAFIALAATAALAALFAVASARSRRT